MSDPRPLAHQWLLLLALTAGTAALSHVVPPVWLPAVVLALVVVKGEIVIRAFMGLSPRSSPLWGVLLGWLLAVVAGVAILRFV